MHLIYTTFPNLEEATRLAHKLVESGLVACANIHSGVTSIYKWQGKVEQTQEFTMFCKVPESKVDEAINSIKQQHIYDCPCVIAIKIEKGNEDFLKWVENCGKVDY